MLETVIFLEEAASHCGLSAVGVGERREFSHSSSSSGHAPSAVLSAGAGGVPVLSPGAHLVGAVGEARGLPSVTRQRNS